MRDIYKQPCRMQSKYAFISQMTRSLMSNCDAVVCWSACWPVCQAGSKSLFWINCFCRGAYGIIIEVESHPFELDTMLFMDWRDDHTAGDMVEANRSADSLQIDETFHFQFDLLFDGLV